MAIQLKTRHRSHRVEWKSGHFYTFRYQAWENDPRPTYIHMYAVLGIHPNTGHQHRYIQGINLTYIPRPHRKSFVKAWTREMERSNGRVEFTWNKVVTTYPYLEGAVRRYMIKPIYYIQDVIPIPLENVEDMVISTWSKDFSKKVRIDLTKKFRKVMGNRKNIKKSFGGVLNRMYRTRR